MAQEKDCMKEEQFSNQRGKRRKPIWIISIIMAVVSATIIISLLPMVDRLDHSHGASFDSVYNMSSLFDYNYALYKMLLSEKDKNYIKYEELFQKDELNLKNYQLESDDKEHLLLYAKTLKDASISRLQSLEQNLKTGDHIQSLDCRIVDVSTGMYYGNIVYEPIEYSEEFLNKYAMYLVISYDQNGKMNLERIKDANESVISRESYKYGTVSYSDRFLISRVDETHQKYYENLSEYLEMKPLKNCTIFWGVREDVWIENFESNYYFDVSDFYNSLGLDILFMVLFFVCLGMGVLIRNPIKRANLEDANNGLDLLQNPPLLLPALSGIFILWMAMDDNVCFSFARLYINTGQCLDYSLQYPQNVWICYGLAYAVMIFYFFWTYYCGVCLANIFRMGIWNYLCHRTLTFFLIATVWKKCKKEIEEVNHLDLTSSVRWKILKIIIINEIILAIITSFWFVGIFFLMIHTVVSYVLITKYVSKLQADFQRLLKATNAIAEGNLDYKIEEDLGVFEPFKPEIAKIEEGFSKAVQEEVKSQKMKSELITNVSHDLKTPLTSIITYINLLQQDNISEEDQKKYIAVLDEKSTKLKSLIEDLFEVSKANSKSIVLHKQKVDLISMLKQLQLDYEDKFAEKNLALRMKFEQEKLYAELDSQKTYRIYENLFSNIYKYALAGTRVYVEGTEQESDICISIKNISEEEITKSPDELTARFVRGDVSRNTEGNGLGLAIVQSFTDAMGGKVIVESDGDLFIVKTIWKKAPVEDNTETETE